MKKSVLSNLKAIKGTMLFSKNQNFTKLLEVLLKDKSYNKEYEKLRSDLLIIEFINRKEKILDVGCGDGSLLKYLSQEKDVKCRELNLV